MIRRQIVVVCFVIAPIFSGCVAMMEGGLNALMGEKYTAAFDVLGYPTYKQEYGTETVYVWVVDRSGSMLLPSTSTVQGYVGSTPVYGTITSTQQVAYQALCNIKLVANKWGSLGRVHSNQI